MLNQTYSVILLKYDEILVRDFKDELIGYEIMLRYI